MSALRSLTVLAPARRAATLCRSGEHTCGACCWGEALTRPALAEQLGRQTWWFRRLAAGDGSSAPPSRASRLRLLLFELIVRRGWDLVWAPLLWLPLVGDCLRPWLRRRLCCAFLGYTDDAQERIGCLLHPARRRGEDRRRQAAFALLRGMGCGRADFFCLAAWEFAHASPARRRAFLARVRHADWFGYSQATQAPPAHASEDAL
jgi:hypothetical protein